MWLHIPIHIRNCIFSASITTRTKHKRGSPLFIEIGIVHHSWCFVHAIKAKATIHRCCKYWSIQTVYVLGRNLCTWLWIAHYAQSVDIESYTIYKVTRSTSYIKLACVNWLCIFRVCIYINQCLCWCRHHVHIIFYRVIEHTRSFWCT